MSIQVNFPDFDIQVNEFKILHFSLFKSFGLKIVFGLKSWENAFFLILGDISWKKLIFGLSGIIKESIFNEKERAVSMIFNIY